MSFAAGNVYDVAMDRIRICQIITELRPAGAERVVYELSTGLDANRFEVHVVGLRGGEVAEWLAARGIPVTVLGVRGKLDVARLRQLIRLLREGRFDLVHTHLFHADVAGRLAAPLAGVPHLVHTVHVAEMRFRPWRFLWARLTDKWCDRIVCCSRAVREHHAEKSGLPRSRYEVIYNGIDADAYRPDPARRAAMREQWGIGPAEVVLSFVGRLDRQKGVEFFLDAAARAHSRRASVRAVIAGDGPQRGMVEKFLARPGAAQWAKWLGFTPHVAGVLAASDVFLIPSRWEGFGIAAAEAMAARLPVIGTRVPGLSEVIEDGVTGLLVDSGDVNALVECIERLADDAPLRERMGRAGEDRVRRLFRIDAHLAAHARLYDDVCSPGRAQRTT